MIAIIDYGAGNIRSVLNALERLGVTATLTADPETIQRADKVLFPGVGQAGSAMRSLRESGLDRLIPELKQPFLGICLGMQLLCQHSEEEDTPCLGIIPLKVKRFPASGLKIPHMGWNDVVVEAPATASPSTNPAITSLATVPSTSAPLADVPFPSTVSTMYFVHSYYVETGPETIAVTQYGIPFSAAIRKDNFIGVQFHPEKSSADGARVLDSFLSGGAR